MEVAVEPWSARHLATEYLEELSALLRQVDLNGLTRIAERLRVARDGGATVFVAGNGGSAATASHLVNDLCKATKRSGRPALRAMSLPDNVSWLTALANDEGYARVFAGQLENLASPGDVLLVLSASGNSPNLLCAVELAASRGMTTIGLLGFDGGLLKDKLSECLWIPTAKGAYGLAEDAQSAVCHALTRCLAEDYPPAASRDERNLP